MDLRIRPTGIPVSVLPLNLLCDFEANHVNQCLPQNGDIIVVILKDCCVDLMGQGMCYISHEVRKSWLVVVIIVIGFCQQV